MIDFDQMRQLDATDITTAFHADLQNILAGIASLLLLVQCLSDDVDVTRNGSSRVLFLGDTLTDLKKMLATMSRISSSVQTADFLADMQKMFHFV